MCARPDQGRNPSKEGPPEQEIEPENGVAIMMISSDMEEVLGESDRVAVMHEGAITGILSRDECTEEAIMRLAVGQK